MCIVSYIFLSFSFSAAFLHGQTIVENCAKACFLLGLPVFHLASSATGSARLHTLSQSYAVKGGFKPLLQNSCGGAQVVKCYIAAIGKESNPAGSRKSFYHGRLKK